MINPRCAVLLVGFSASIVGCSARSEPEDKIVGKWIGRIAIDMERLADEFKDNVAQRLMMSASAPAVAKDASIEYLFSSDGKVQKEYSHPENPLTGQPTSMLWSGTWRVLDPAEATFRIECEYAQAPGDPNQPVTETLEIQFDSETEDACVAYQSFEIYNLARAVD